MNKIVLSLCLGLLSTISLAATPAVFPDEPFKAQLNDQASLQNGARLFVQYCFGCHSLKYQRYNRMARDLGIEEDVLKRDFIFTGAKIGETMVNGMSAVDGEKWFGVAPPDLSLTARAKTSRYIYNYLQAFYYDPARPFSFNNSRFAGASMPNPFWQLQGVQLPETEILRNCATNSAGAEECVETENIIGFKVLSEGSLSSAEFQKMVYDITNFLTYVSDPSAAKRHGMGIWVLLFLLVMTIIFYFLKKEYWRDVH